MRGTGRSLIIVIVFVVIIFLGYNYLTNKSSGMPNGLKDCGNGVYVNQYASCPNTTAQAGNGGTSSSSNSNTPNSPPTTDNPIIGNNNGPQVVTTPGNPCPTHDFSLQKGGGECNFPGGKLLICEGDLSDSLGVHHDSDATTGQVDQIDQSATIDGRDNGGSCHYSPPWTLQMSISSEKGGCGGGCASVQVFKDGQQVQ